MPSGPRKTGTRAVVFLGVETLKESPNAMKYGVSYIVCNTSNVKRRANMVMIW